MSAHSSTFEVPGEVRTWKLKRVKVLGKGSYGLATLVEDTETSELLVAKEINMSAVKDMKEVENLYQEIKILKAVQHPNVVAYKDCFFDGTQCMTILMEYCDGGDLAQKLQTHNRSQCPMTEAEVSSIFIQLLMALKHLHMDHRILHRDLKPQNVFLTKDGLCKLGDFGVSTILGQSVDMAKTFCGSPYYLAPELCEEKPYNGKADLWSLGVILYECCNKGERPFAAKNLVALVLAITKAQYEKLPEGAYPSELTDIIYSFLQRLPDARPTIRRLLRMPFTQSHVLDLPEVLLTVDEYDKQLGSKRLLRERQLKAKQQASAGAGPSSELDAWIAGDRAKMEALENHNGFGGTETLTERERRIMQQQSSPPNSSSSGATGTTGAATSARDLEDDELWNSKYADDEFEEEDPEEDEYRNWTVHNTMPVTNMTFSL